jgi:hypothetical protein
VDDFTFFHQCRDRCGAQWQWFMSDCAALGLTMHEGKSEPPAQQQRVLGIVWDSVAMTAALDADKVRALKAKLSAFAARRKCTKAELQSLLGHLYYASRVVLAGRAFVFHLAQLLRAAASKAGHHRLHVTSAAKADVQWWLQHVDVCNGQQAILPHAPVLWRVFQTDASLTGAGGDPCVGIWIQGGYASLSAPQLRGMFADVPPPSADINLWELYAVVVACRLYADHMSGAHWRVRTDNQACEAWIMRGVRAHPLAAAWLADVMSTAVRYGFRITAKYVPGAQNLVADALSRRQWPAFAACLARHRAGHAGEVL